jgi:trehalose-phosphatase
LAAIATRRSIAIVSGRDLDDLRERVGLDAIYYAGSHGFRMAGPEGWSREYDDARYFLPELDRAEEELEQRLASIEGVQVERKRYAIAVHFRRAPQELVEDVRRVVEDVRDAGHGLRFSEGRKVFELRPDLPWDKGKAVAWILGALGGDRSSSFPIYMGDDLTDESGFRAVELDGLAIVVRGREGSTFARYALEDPRAVCRFLTTLDEKLGPR